MEIIERYRQDLEGGPKRYWAVVNEENKVLCQGVRDFPFMIYYPILWRDYVAAAKWTESGCIADIQEAHTNLHVRFTNQQIVRVD